MEVPVAGRMCHTMVALVATEERFCELVVFGGLTEFKRGSHHCEQPMVAGTAFVELGENA